MATNERVSVVELVVAPAVGVARGSEDVALAVAGDPAWLLAAKPLDALELKRPPEDVTPDDDLVDSFGCNVGEHRLERREVAVDVVQRSDPHAGDATRAAQASSGSSPGS